MDIFMKTTRGLERSTFLICFLPFFETFDENSSVGISFELPIRFL